MARVVGFEQVPDVRGRIREAAELTFPKLDDLITFVSENLKQTVGATRLQDAVDDLLRNARASGELGHLLRRARRHRRGSPLAVVADQVLSRITTPEETERLKEIVTSQPSLWSILVPLADRIPALPDYQYYRGEWLKPGYDIALDAYCQDLIDQLAEEEKREDLPLQYPLLQFVRWAIGDHRVAALVGPQLRVWLRDVALRTQVPYTDLTAVCRPEAESQVREIAAQLQTYEISTAVRVYDPAPNGWRVLLGDALDRSGYTAVCLDAGRANWGKPDPQSTEVDAQINPPLQRLHLFPLLLPGLEANHPQLYIPKTFEPNAQVSFQSPDDAVAIARVQTTVTGKVAPIRRPVRLSPMPKRLAKALTEEGLVILVGPAASAPPSGYEVALKLLATLEAVADATGDADKGTPRGMVPPRDVVGSYFALKQGVNMLRDAVSKLVSLPDLRKNEITAQLVAVLQKASAQLAKRPARTGVDRRPLVITTNLDLNLERTLLCEGLAFTRVVQLATARVREATGGAITPERRFPSAPPPSSQRSEEVWVSVDDYHVRAIDTERQRLHINDDEWNDVNFASATDLDAAIKRSGRVRRFDPLRPWKRWDVEEIPDQPEDTRPVLYKMHGSCDVDSSPLVSSDDYDNFDVSRVPAEVLSRVRTSPLLFLGYSWLDPEFRHLRRTLLRGCATPGEKEEKRRFAIHIPLQQSPLHWADQALHDNMRQAWQAPPLSAEFHDEEACADMLKSVAEALSS
jgi:hypothetical protein